MACAGGIRWQAMNSYEYIDRDAILVRYYGNKKETSKSCQV